VKKIATLLACCLVLLARHAAAEEIEKLTFGLEVSGHLPGDAPLLVEGDKRIDATDLSPPVHTFALTYGVVLPTISSELLLRTGYRFASGSFPEGSIIRSQTITGYSLSAVPVGIGWRMVIAPSWIRFFAGAGIGLTFANFTYEGSGLANGWHTQVYLRGLIGIHLGFGDSWGIRLFGEGLLQSDLDMAPAPTVSFDGLGAGATLVIEVDRPEPGSMATPEESGEPMLRDFGHNAAGGMEAASALIREADDAARIRDFIRAEELYREGVHKLPRDPRTRRNLEVPVRIDWAKALIEIGRSTDAREVLLEAQRIEPGNPQVQELLDSIGTADEVDEQQNLLQRDMPSPFPTRR